MTNFCDLPTEVCIIAENLTKSELFKLKSVNSLFLNCWADIRWKIVEVRFDERDPETVVRLLTRMADHFVAVRTKTLSIRLKLAESTNVCFNTALTVLPLLSNLTFLSINLIKISTSHAATFFRTITSSSGAKTLRKLSLMGDVKYFASLGECSADNTPFKNLTQLSLFLNLDLDDSSNTQTEPSLTLKPFLCSVAPTLQNLVMWNSSSTLDLSPLFDTLQPVSQFDTPVLFPNLKYFCLSCNLRTFQSLRRFLLTYNNLKRLALNPTRRTPSRDTEKLWGACLVDLVNSNSLFPSLESLSIYPSTTQAGLSAVMTLIKLTTSTLSSLTISVRYLTFEEAKQVVDALTASEVQVQGPTTATPEEPGKLKNLSMNITHLSVSFLDLLAHKLPQLETLYLDVTENISSDQFYDVLQHRRYDPNITCTRDVLHTWKLHNLWIVRGWDDDMGAVRAVADAVPALSRRMRLNMYDGFLGM